MPGGKPYPAPPPIPPYRPDDIPYNDSRALVSYFTVMSPGPVFTLLTFYHCVCLITT